MTEHSRTTRFVWGIVLVIAGIILGPVFGALYAEQGAGSNMFMWIPWAIAIVGIVCLLSSFFIGKESG